MQYRRCAARTNSVQACGTGWTLVGTGTPPPTHTHTTPTPPTHRHAPVFLRRRKYFAHASISASYDECNQGCVARKTELTAGREQSYPSLHQIHHASSPNKTHCMRSHLCIAVFAHGCPGFEIRRRRHTLGICHQLWVASQGGIVRSGALGSRAQGPPHPVGAASRTPATAPRPPQRPGPAAAAP